LIMLEFSDPTGETPATLKDLEVVFGNLVNVVLGFAGVVLLIMLVLGGFKYIHRSLNLKFFNNNLP